jgi:hypothetical protein
MKFSFRDILAMIGKFENDPKKWALEYSIENEPEYYATLLLLISSIASCYYP